MPLNNTKITKIAVFRALKVGDLLVSIPGVRALRNHYPKAQITLISLPWAEEFITHYPHLFDQFFAFPGYEGLPEQPFDKEKTAAFLKRMQKEHFDLVIQMHGNGTIVNPMIALFGASLTAGYYPEEQEELCFNGKTFMPYPLKEHEIKRHIRLMEFLGIPNAGLAIEFTITRKDQEAFMELSDTYDLNPKHYICIHAGGISGGRWPEKDFAKVADFLAKLGYQIVLTGTVNEGEIAEAVMTHMQHKAVSLIGQTDLGTLACLLKYSALLISNDTGVSHLAAAVRTPSVVIFTTSDPLQWAPLDTSLHHAIMKSNISDYRVVAIDALSLLKQNAKPISLLKGAQL